MEFLKEVEESGDQIEYVLAANKEAMALYKIAKETLMESPSFDFMVYEFDSWDSVIKELGEWEDYVSIDEATYKLLYRNLCIKFKVLMEYLYH